MSEIKESGSIEDGLVGLFYNAVRSKTYNRKLWVNRIIWLILLFALSFWYYTLGFYPSWVFAIIAALIIAFFIYYPKRFMRINIKHYRKHLKNKKLEMGDSYTDFDVFKFYENSFVISSNGITTTVESIAIKEIVEVKTHLILILKAGGTISINKDSENYSTFKSHFKELCSNYTQDLEWKI